MSFGDHPFNRFHNFNPESKLSEFRKRFEDFAQESNNRSNNMFFDSRQPNGWPTGLKDRNIYSMAKNANINNPNNESEGIPIKVFHEKSNETPINCNEERHEVNSDSISCDGSQHSHKSSAQQSSSSSGESSGHSSGFHSNGSQSQSHEASAEPRVHHIPIKVEPRDSSEPNASPNTTNTSENPLSRSSSNSSRHSVQSGGSRFARSPSPAKSVSSSHSNVSSNSLNSSTSGKPRVCQIPIKVETNDSQKSKSPLSSDNIPKVKTTGLGQSTGSGQSRIKPKSKSGPFVTRIPVVGESNISSEEQSSTSQSPPKQNIKLDPLEIINRILNDLQKYEIEVNEFNGTSDKKYRYLDEMLTRCIIKLDTIETEGKEEVRKARKAAILAVNKCIALLESKVKTDSNNHTNETPTDEQMVVSTPEPTNEMNEKVTEEQVEPIQVDDKVDNQQENVECNENANDSQSQTSVSKNDQKSAGNGPRKETAV